MHSKALQLNKALGIKDGMARDCANLGIVYGNKGNKVEAKHYYQKSLELFKQLGRPNAKLMQSLLDILQ